MGTQDRWASMRITYSEILCLTFYSTLSPSAQVNAGVKQITAMWVLREITALDAAMIARHRYYDSRASIDDHIAYADWVEQAIERGTYFGRVAEVGGLPVAGAGIVVLDWGPTRGNPDGRRARLANVYTEPAWRRNGIVRCMVETLLEQVRGSGIKVVSLGASKASENLYRSFGFEFYSNEMVRHEI